MFEIPHTPFNCYILHTHETYLPLCTLMESHSSIVECRIDKLDAGLNTPLDDSTRDTGNMQRLREPEGQGERKEREAKKDGGGSSGDRIFEDYGSPLGLAIEAFEIFLYMDGVVGCCARYALSSLTLSSLSSEIGD